MDLTQEDLFQPTLDWQYVMTYKEAERQLKQMNGRSVSLGPWRSATWLAQRQGYFSVDNNGNELIRMYPDGTVQVRFTQWNSLRQGYPRPKTLSIYCERRTINQYFTHRLKWYFYSYRHHTMIKRIKRNADYSRRGGWECPQEIMFDADGNTDQNLFGVEFASLQSRYKHIDYEREKPRRRGRYWQARVRNLYLDKKDCQYNGNMQEGCERAQAIRRRWQTGMDINHPQIFGCGCRLYRKQMGFKYSITKILKEPNSTVRMCMIKLYGIERFFKDSNANEISHRDKYQLYRLKLPGNSWNANEHERGLHVLTALRMVCPSTGDTFVHLVPNHCESVDHALNWKYDVPDYRNMVKRES